MDKDEIPKVVRDCIQAIESRGMVSISLSLPLYHLSTFTLTSSSMVCYESNHVILSGLTDKCLFSVSGNMADVMAIRDKYNEGSECSV